MEGQKMRAAVLFGKNDLRVVEKDIPKPQGDEVLVRVRACAICGSDPKIIQNGWPKSPPFGEFVPGHEFAGEIVALGDRASRFTTGVRVAIEPHRGCGICENCIRGKYTTCLNYGDK
jgi:L-iditol 2-dehydrogenase